MTTTPDFLLSVFLRGGADGLTLLCPYDDPDYQTKRKQTRVYPPGTGNGKEALPLTSANGNTPAFGLHPGMAPLLPHYQQGDLCFVHATGSIDDTRSHFDQMHYVETATHSGTPGIESTGWLARHLLSTAPIGSGLLRGIAVRPQIPRILRGAPAVTPTHKPESFVMWGDEATAPARRVALEAMYARFGQPLDGSIGAAFSTIDRLELMDWDVPPAAGVTYPESELGGDLYRAAQMAKQLSDLELVHVERGGWDLHSAQGVWGGKQDLRASDLAGGIDAFLRDMAGESRKVIVLIVTEFGRALDENASDGTDHGRASIAMVAGDHAAGGQVITNWPGLAPGQLAGGDLAVTIDVRDLMAEVMTERLMNPNLGAVFTDPTYTYTRQGVIA